MDATLARSVNLRCCTALVTYNPSRSTPAASSALSSSAPAGPTNGSPARSSRSPGCSPTSISDAVDEPRPNTVCSASRNNSSPGSPLLPPYESVQVGDLGQNSRHPSQPFPWDTRRIAIIRAPNDNFRYAPPAEHNTKKALARDRASRVTLQRNGVQAVHQGYICCTFDKGHTVAKDHCPSVKNDKQYEGLREKGMSKSRAAAISNSPGASSRGGKSSGSSRSKQSTGSGSGGNSSQKKAAGARAARSRARQASPRGEASRRPLR